MNLKRDNWTTDEVIDIIKGFKLVPREKKDTYANNHNEALDDAVEAFADFKRPVEELGAMAYCPDDGFIYHVGTIPEEIKIPAKGRA